MIADVPNGRKKLHRAGPIRIRPPSPPVDNIFMKVMLYSHFASLNRRQMPVGVPSVTVARSVAETRLAIVKRMHDKLGVTGDTIALLSTFEIFVNSAA